MNANLKEIRGPFVAHQLVTAQQAMSRLACDDRELERRVRDGRVACYQIGRHERYDLEPPEIPEPEPREPRRSYPIEVDCLLDAMALCAHDEQTGFDATWPLVYIVQAGEDGPLKIGSTRSLASLKSRLATMQVASPELLYVRRLLRGTAERERCLHARFERYRIRGEWFRPTAPLLEFAGVSIRVLEEVG